MRIAIILGLLLVGLWAAEATRHMFERGPVIKMHGWFAWDTENKQCVEFKQVKDGTAFFVTRDDLTTEAACKGQI